MSLSLRVSSSPRVSLHVSQQLDFFRLIRPPVFLSLQSGSAQSERKVDATTPWDFRMYVPSMRISPPFVFPSTCMSPPWIFPLHVYVPSLLYFPSMCMFPSVYVFVSAMCMSTRVISPPCMSFSTCSSVRSLRTFVNVSVHVFLRVSLCVSLRVSFCMSLRMSLHASRYEVPCNPHMPRFVPPSVSVSLCVPPLSLHVSARAGAARVVFRPNVRINLMQFGAAAAGGPFDLVRLTVLLISQRSLARGQAYVGATATGVIFWPNYWSVWYSSAWGWDLAA